MTLNEMIELLNNDLKNEWKHMNFYLYHAGVVTGLHCHEYKEFLLESAASEMKHVSAFSDLIVGLGGRPEYVGNPFEMNAQYCNHPQNVLEMALRMEEEVVENYVKRMQDASALMENDPVNGQWIEIFLENQIQDSRQDADHIKQMLR